MASGVLDKGTTLAGYRIDGVLGQGGMGVVYEATQLSLDRIVALKVLASHLTEDITFIQRFQREGQIQAKIDHAHIVTVFDSGKSDSGFFIAMRLVRGPNLKDMIVSRELDPGRTLRILTPVADALDTAHAAGLIHRDIKPQNVLVGGRDQAFLADFGLTKATGDKSLTKTGQFVGTLDYISPEQIKGEHATTASDVYALAAVLYECLTGVVPFPKDSEAAVLYAHMADPPPEVSKERPDLPAQLDTVLVRAMAKDPGERFQSAGELLREINQAFSRKTRAAFTPPGPIEIPEETGIRAAEADVSTRETPTQEPAADGPAETRLSPAPPETAPAGEPPPQDAEPAETRVGEPAAEAPAPPAPAETRTGEPPPDTEQRDEVPEETGTRESSETVVGAAGGETKLSPGETRRGKAVAETKLGGTPAAAAAGAAGGAAATKAGATAAPPRRPAAPPAERKGTPPLAIGAGVALLALLIVGFLIGRSGGGGEAEPASGRAVTAGPLELSAPGDWRATPRPTSIPGLEFEGGSTTLAPGAEAGEGTLTMGLTNATGLTLLPTDFLARLDKPPALDDPVKLGDLEAYRYRNLRPEGFDQRLTLYVAGTTEGVATVACAAPAAKAAGFLPDCEGAATSLALTSGVAYALGPDEDYQEALDGTIEKLNSSRASGVRTLRRARTAGGQAKAAKTLQSAYSAAGRSLRGVQVSPAFTAANGELVEALRATAKGYERMAAGARANSRSRYNRGRRDVSRGEAAIARTLKGLEEPGG